MKHPPIHANTIEQLLQIDYANSIHPHISMIDPLPVWLVRQATC